MPQIIFTRKYLKTSLVMTAILISGFAMSWLAYKTFFWPPHRLGAPPVRPLLVAHGGGVVNQVRLSNSLEAIENSYQLGFRLFEIDFSWVASGDLVAIHDWERTYVRLFGKDLPPETSIEFGELPMTGGLTPLTLSRLLDWLSQREDAYLVTDIKSRNIEGLMQIGEFFGPLKTRVIPQIYEPEELEAAAALGYENIIYTLYKTSKNPLEIMAFVSNNKLYAVTIPWSRLKRWNLGRRLNRLGVAVYAHTVNEAQEAREMKRSGATGFYTDSMTFSDFK